MIRSILLAAAFTIIVETSFLFAVGYRNRPSVLACALINFITNSALNCALALIPAKQGRLLICPLELAVVLIEWGALRLFTQNRRWLPAFVFLANLLSFSVGLLIQYIGPCSVSG
jgi:hypothetical protein